MGSVGDAYDNAMCESFLASLKCELLDRRSFATVREARREIFRFIEGFYNTRRLHSALGYVSPSKRGISWGESGGQCDGRPFGGGATAPGWMCVRVMGGTRPLALTR